MIVIAVLALACCGEVLRKRSAEFARLSRSCTRLALDCEHRVVIAEAGVSFTDRKIVEEGESPQWKEQLRWWSEQRDKYRARAVRFRELGEQFQAASGRPWGRLPLEVLDSPDPLLPPPDLPLIFTVDPKTNVPSPL
jgi:hypothetical protein